MEEFKPKFTLEELRKRDTASLEQRKEVYRKKIYDALKELYIMDDKMEAKSDMLRAFDRSQYRSKEDPMQFTEEHHQRAANYTKFLVEQKNRWDAVKAAIHDFMLTFPGANDFDEFLTEYTKRYEG